MSEKKKDKKTKQKKQKLAYFTAAVCSKKFKDSFNNKELSDATIVFPKGDSFPAHKIVLANSEVIEKELENNSTYTFDKNINDESAKTVVKFLYTGLLEYDSEAVLVDFMLLANKLKVKHLTEFKVSPKVYLKGILEYVEKDQENRLSEFGSLLGSVDFKKLEKEDLEGFYKKRKWLHTQPKFLHQLIMKYYDDEEEGSESEESKSGSDSESKSGSDSEDSKSGSDSESKSEESEEEEEEDGEEEGKQFKFKKCEDNKGIIYYLGTSNGKKKEFTNPMTLGLVDVTCTNSLGTGKLSDFCDRVLYDAWVSSSSQSSLTWDFKKKKVKLNHYTVRQFNQSCCYPRGWDLEGSTNGKKYELIQKYDDSSITSQNQVKDFKVKKCKKFYRYIRIVHRTQNSSNWNWGLQLEVYGYLK